MNLFEESKSTRLEGVIHRITFQNPENGYTVARLKLTQPSTRRIGSGPRLVTVVGSLPTVQPGERVVLLGQWVNDPKYGQQFRVNAYETLPPLTLEGIRRYLGSGLIKGIGPVNAKRIVDHFKLDTLEIIENAPERLMEVEGIGEKRVKMIRDAWQAQKDIKELMLFLGTHGVSTAYAVKIYKHYGKEALNILRNNPYRLAEEVWGIGFITADRIAQSLGIKEDSPARLEAGLKYVLNEATEEGHVYLPREELVKRSSKILKAPAESVTQALETLVAREQLIAEEDKIYLPFFYHAEKGLAERLNLLARVTRIRFGLEFAGEEIDLLEGSQGIRFNRGQREAILKAMTNEVLVLTGGPGTGKTTTVQGMIQLFERHKLKLLLAAPTGRAAKRLSEVTGRPAKTIHRLLEYSPSEMKFKRTRDNPLSADVVIVDEASMLDLPLTFHLVRAIPPEAKLILVGDVDQLPSVGPGNVLRDIINSGLVEVVQLKEIFRQARDSMIVVNAHRINRGLFPNLRRRTPKGEAPVRGLRPRDDYGDFLFAQEEDPHRIVELIRDLCTRRLPQRYGYDPLEDIQVLSPMYKGVIGADNLNSVLQSCLNPGGEELQRGGTTFRVGDKVMQIRNNYEKGVFNGDLGRIISIDWEEQEVTVEYDFPVRYDFNELDEIVLAYTITVHKSQGSEYKAVIMPIVIQHYVMLQRNLLYTAVTRAKELLILIGSKKALAIAVKNDKVTGRYSALRERLREI